MKPVAIVGAGISGLTAASYLQQQGVPVVIYEASGRAGGMIGTTSRQGFLAEHGPNTIMTNSVAVPRLVRDLGLESRRLLPSSSAATRYIVRNRRLVQVPQSLSGAIGTKLLSFPAKLRVLAEPFIAKMPIAKTPEVDESLAAFVRRRLGGEFLDYLIDPFIAGVYAGNPEQLSITHALPRMAALEQRYGSLIKGALRGARERRERNAPLAPEPKMFSFDHGLQVLTDTLAVRLKDALRLNCAVHGVEPARDGWRILTPDGSDSFGSILFCLPAHLLSRFQALPELAGELNKFEQVYYPPITRLGLGFRSDQVAHPLDGFGALVPRKERMSILGVLFSSSMFENRAPLGHVLLTVFAGGARQPALARLSRSEIEQLALHDVRILLGISGSPVFTDTAMMEHSIPQYNVGYGRVKDLISRIEARFPGLYLAGSFRHGISVSDCIASGAAAADKVGRMVAS